MTAVAIGPDYQCHSCGREFMAGLVRVPRAWGDGGQVMKQAASMALPWPEAATIEEDTLAAQVAAMGRALPERPLVLGGWCCSHVGAVRELARRHGRIGVVWLDAHGDLNTPESSPSGNAWGMPLRMLIDAGDVQPADVTLVGARNLDPPEVEFIAEAGVRQELGELPERLYVALDGDVIDPPGRRRLHAGARRDHARPARGAPRRPAAARRCRPDGFCPLRAERDDPAAPRARARLVTDRPPGAV